MQGFPAWQGLRTSSFLPGWGDASAGYKSQCHRRSPRVEIKDGHGSDMHALILSSHHHLSHSAARVRLRNSKQTLDCRRPKRQSPCEKHLDGHDSGKKTSHTSYTKLRSCILHQRQGASDPTRATRGRQAGSFGGVGCNSALQFRRFGQFSRPVLAATPRAWLRVGNPDLPRNA